MAKHITVRAAQPDTRDQEIETVIITISGCFPYSLSDEEVGETRRGFVKDAEKLFRALMSLPGGTFCHLLGLMLREKASHFIVSHKQPEDYRKMEAASELYNALEALLPDFAGTFEGRTDEYDVMVDQARAAIRKARGESEAQDVKG